MCALRESLDSQPFNLCETFGILRESTWTLVDTFCESLCVNGLSDSRQNSSPDLVHIYLCNRLKGLFNYLSDKYYIFENLLI